MGKTDYLNFGVEDWYERGQRLTRVGRHSEAIEALSQAIAKNPAPQNLIFRDELTILHSNFIDIFQ